MAREFLFTPLGFLFGLRIVISSPRDCVGDIATTPVGGQRTAFGSQLDGAQDGAQGGGGRRGQ